eukprot:m.335536 g.335536  ORF g.335536 m.335536 type:complete len:1121 (-) comp17624_c0_seq1:166-3528(-)
MSDTLTPTWFYTKLIWLFGWLLYLIFWIMGVALFSTTWLSFINLAQNASHDAGSFVGVLLAIGIPQAMTFGMSTLRYLNLSLENRKKKGLTAKMLAYYSLCGIFETCGVVWLVFTVFTFQSAVISTSLLCGIAIAPLLIVNINSFFLKGEGKVDMKKKILNIAGIVLQIAGIATVASENYKLVHETASTIAIIGGVLLVSFLWVDAIIIHPELQEKSHCRYSASMAHSGFSIFTLVIASVIMAKHNLGVGFFFHDFWLHLGNFLVADHQRFYLLANLVCGILSHVLAVSLIQVQFPKTLASVLIVSPVVCFVLLAVDCFWHPYQTLLPTSMHWNVSCPADVDPTGTATNKQCIAWEIAFFVCFWLSYVCATSHMWEKVKRPLQRAADIFYLPVFSTIFGLLSYAFKRKACSDPDVEFDDVKNVLYVCATLYRENKHEMKQLFDSLTKLSKAWPKCNKGQLEIMIMFDKPFDKNGEEIEECKYWQELITEYSKQEKEPEDKYYWKLITTKLGERVKMRTYLKRSGEGQRIKHLKRWSMMAYMYLIKKEIRKGLRNLKKTFILTLDGDVKFEPAAVWSMMDRLRSCPHLGGVTGKIRPLGGPASMNPLVAFQKFEYAVGHWMLKTAENMFGTVLCLPGCFAMFRASAMLDDFVMKEFAKSAENGIQSLKLDMGEDRFLCLLLIRIGFTLAYLPSAVADTYCPVDWEEFLKQRRRWITSTLANQIEVIARGPKICRKTNGINMSFICLQAMLLVASLISPVVVTLVITGSVSTLVGSTKYTIFICLMPVVYAALLLLPWGKNSGLPAALSLIVSIGYAALMASVCVAIARQLTLDFSNNKPSPGSVFFVSTAAIMVVVALANGLKELGILIRLGLLYFFSIPAAYVVLPIYAYCNVADHSWGTRQSTEDNVGEKSNNAPGVWCLCGSLLWGCGLGKPPQQNLSINSGREDIEESTLTKKKLKKEATSSEQQENNDSKQQEEAQEPAEETGERLPLQFTQYPSKELVNNKNRSLQRLTWEILSVVLVINLIWLLGQLLLFKTPELFLFGTNADVFSFAFLFMFGFLMILFLFAGIAQAWIRLEEILVYYLNDNNEKEGEVEVEDEAPKKVASETTALMSDYSDP